MKIILGSESRWRKSILKDMGYDFEVMPAHIDEKAIRFDDPEKLVTELAKAKADALFKKIKEDVILITADQVVVSNGKILEKPENEEEAREYLRSYEKYPAKSVVAIAVVNTKTMEKSLGVDIAEIVFNKIPDDEIEKLISQGDIFSCAGGFTIENPIIDKYVKSINGAPDSIKGLPIELTRKLINKIS